MDYVNKTAKAKPRKHKRSKPKKSSAKNNNHSRRNQQNKLTKPIAGISIIAIVVLIGFFVLTDNSSTDASADSNNQTQDNATSNSNSGFEAPPLPKDDYGFSKKLAKDKPPGDGSSYPVPDAVPHRLLCGAFKQQTDANKVAAKIKQLTPINVTKSGSWYVVTTPFFQNKRTAEDFKNKIRKTVNVYDCVLRKQ